MSNTGPCETATQKTYDLDKHKGGVTSRRNAVSNYLFLAGMGKKSYERLSYPLESDLEGASRLPGPPFAAIAQTNIPRMVVRQAQNEIKKNLLSLYGGVVRMATNTTQ